MTHVARACFGLVAMLGAGCGRLGFESLPITSADGGVPDASVDAAHVGDAGCSTGTFDPCFALDRLPAAPTIDGVLEPCLTTRPITPDGWTAATPIPTSLHARAAYAWRPDGIYFYVEVDDPSLFPASAPTEPFCGDGVEVYVDDDGRFARSGSYDMPGTIQLIAASPTSSTGASTYGTAYTDGGYRGTWSSSRFAMVGRPGGYALETLVQASDLGLASWSLVAGQHVGIDLSINVSTIDGSTATSTGSCGTRLGQFFLRALTWSIGCGDPYCDTRAFCTPSLR